MDNLNLNLNLDKEFNHNRLDAIFENKKIHMDKLKNLILDHAYDPGNVCIKSILARKTANTVNGLYFQIRNIVICRYIKNELGKAVNKTLNISLLTPDEINNAFIFSGCPEKLIERGIVVYVNNISGKEIKVEFTIPKERIKFTKNAIKLNGVQE